jgi:hypothetical protein
MAAGRWRLSAGRIIALLAAWLALTSSALAVYAARQAPPNARATLWMGLGLIIVWVGLGGLLMRLLRQPLRNLVLGVRLDWRVKFVLLAIVLPILCAIPVALVVSTLHPVDVHFPPISDP